MEGIIPAKPGLYPAVRFRYRVALPDEVDQLFLFPAKSGRENTAAVAKLLKAHLESWDVPRACGDGPEPITEDTLRRLHYTARQTILDFVTGHRALEEQDRQEKN